MKIVMRLVAIAFLLGAFVFQASAQTSSASISGHVIDQSKSAIPNAEVKLLDQSTNVVISTHTSATATLFSPTSQPGTYTAIVTAVGFKEVRKVDLVLYASVEPGRGTITLVDRRRAADGDHRSGHHRAANHKLRALGRARHDADRQSARHRSRCHVDDKDHAGCGRK